jgi:nitrogen regulatory protein P-II 1
MKEIKAYIQRWRVNKVVDELQKAGAPGITIVEIHPVGYGYEPNYFEQNFEDAFKRYKINRIVKIEIVCADEDLERLLTVIQATCKTGAKGDGWIFVGEISMAMRIRDGARDTRALKSEKPE